MRRGSGGDPGPDPIAVCEERVDLPLDAGGRLAAAARLDALGVEVLQAVERRGIGEGSVRLAYAVGLEPVVRSGAAAPDFQDFGALHRLVPPRGEAHPDLRIRAVRCAAYPRASGAPE